MTSYSPGQDVEPALTIAGGMTVLSGNTYKAFRLPCDFTISQFSTLTFEFQSPKQFEVQGIGIARQTHDYTQEVQFKVYGTQTPDLNWVVAEQYQGSGKWQKYVFRLAEYLQLHEPYYYLTLIHDCDSNAVSASAFTDISLQSALDFDAMPVSPAVGQDSNPMLTTSASSAVLHGSTWKAFELPSEFFVSRSYASLSFEFQSWGECEIHGIGLATGSANDIRPIVLFQVYGTQTSTESWVVKVAEQYYGTGDWQPYRIWLADYLELDLNTVHFIMLAHDCDEVLQSDSAFRNVVLSQAPGPASDEGDTMGTAV